jgi:hypothetical protein
VSIADHIIKAGPFAAGQVLPPELVREVFKTARLNELRDELIAGRQARGLDGATPTIHTTWAEFYTKQFWDERINPVAAAHGLEPPDMIDRQAEDTHVFKHPDGRVLLMIRIDREDA